MLQEGKAPTDVAIQNGHSTISAMLRRASEHKKVRYK